MNQLTESHPLFQEKDMQFFVWSQAKQQQQIIHLAVSILFFWSSSTRHDLLFFKW